MLCVGSVGQFHNLDRAHCSVYQQYNIYRAFQKHLISFYGLTCMPYLHTYAVPLLFLASILALMLTSPGLLYRLRLRLNRIDPFGMTPSGKVSLQQLIQQVSTQRVKKKFKNIF